MPTAQTNSYTGVANLLMCDRIDQTCGREEIDAGMEIW